MTPGVESIPPPPRTRPYQGRRRPTPATSELTIALAVPQAGHGSTQNWWLLWWVQPSRLPAGGVGCGGAHWPCWRVARRQLPGRCEGAMVSRCAFCGSASAPLVEGDWLFPICMCVACQTGPGPARPATPPRQHPGRGVAGLPEAGLARLGDRNKSSMVVLNHGKRRAAGLEPAVRVVDEARVGPPTAAPPDRPL